MRRLFIELFFFCGVVSAFLPNAHAQATPVRPVPGIELRAISIGQTLEGLQFASYRDGKAILSGKMPAIYSRFRSDPVDYKGAPEILFFDQTPPVNLFAEKDKLAPLLPLGKCHLPDGTTKILLVFVPATGRVDGMKYEVLAMDDTATKFPMGTYLFMNFSKRKLVGMVGKTKFEVSPSGRADVNPDLPGGGGTNVWLFSAENLQTPLIQEAWYHYPTSRVIVMLRDGPGDPAQLLLSSISEFAPTAQPKTPEGQ